VAKEPQMHSSKCEQQYHVSQAPFWWVAGYNNCIVMPEHLSIDSDIQHNINFLQQNICPPTLTTSCANTM